MKVYISPVYTQSSYKKLPAKVYSYLHAGGNAYSMAFSEIKNGTWQHCSSFGERAVNALISKDVNKIGITDLPLELQRIAEQKDFREWYEADLEDENSNLSDSAPPRRASRKLVVVALTLAALVVVKWAENAGYLPLVF